MILCIILLLFLA